MTMHTRILIPFAVLSLSHAVAADSTNSLSPGSAIGPPPVRGFRGDGSGVYAAARPPTVWDGKSGRNVLWTSEVGKGQSSPVVCGDRVFVAFEAEGLLCLDRGTARTLWKTTNDFASLPAGFKAPEQPPAADGDCGFAAATPVTDGRRVWMSYGTGIVVCYDLDGKRQWVRFFDRPLATEFGRSASPRLAGGRLLVTVNELMALDPDTGQTLWECAEAVPAYGTPAVLTVAGTEVAITPKGAAVRIADGKVLGTGWGDTPYSSPVIAQGAASFGMPVEAYKLPDTVAGFAKPALLWDSSDPGGDSFASPVVYDGVFYTVGNDAILWAFDAATGAACYRQELPIRSGRGGGEAEANVYGSPTIAGGHLFVGNDKGELLVIAAGRAYREEARNLLPEGSGATPVADGTQLFLRGGSLLYCIGAK
jgi:outer membrane protein assembly factor BamB